MPKVPKVLKRRKGKKFAIGSALVHAGIGFGCIYFLTWHSIPGYILAVLSVTLEVVYQIVENADIKDHSWREIGEVMAGVVAGGVFFRLIHRL